MVDLVMSGLRRPAFSGVPVDLVASLALAAVTCVVSAPALGNGWIDHDGDQNFLANPHYRGLGPAQLRWMAERRDPGSLDAADMADSRPRLHAVGHEPGRLSPRQHPAARHQRRALRRGRATAAGGSAAGHGSHAATARRPGRRAPVRVPSAARGVGRLDHGAPRRPRRAVLPAYGARVAALGDAGGP